MFNFYKLFMVSGLSLSLLLVSADLNGAQKPKLIKIGNITTTGGPGFSSQSFRSGGSGPAGYEGILSNKGHVTNNNSFGGEVTGRVKGSVTHGFLRDQLSVLERDDGDVIIVRSEMDVQWQDTEGNQYDFQGFGFFKGKLDILLKFFTTGSIEDEEFYWTYVGFFYTDSPDGEKYSHHVAIVKFSRQQLLDAQGNFISEGKLYIVEDRQDTWDDALAPAAEVEDDEDEQ